MIMHYLRYVDVKGETPAVGYRTERVKESDSVPAFLYGPCGITLLTGPIHVFRMTDLFHDERFDTTRRQRQRFNLFTKIWEDIE